MKHNSLLLISVSLVAGVLIAVSRPSSAQDAKGPDTPINLQSSTPGTAQIGHGNITGTFKAGYLKGIGLGITGINANNIAVGTLSSLRLQPNVVLNDKQADFYSYMYMHGKSLHFLDSFEKDRFYVSGFDGWGDLLAYGATGKSMAGISCLSGYHSNGYINVYDSAGTNQAGMYVGSDGKGRLFADIKNFRIPNPQNIQEDIEYACIEGPEAATYVRGTVHLVNGHAHVDLPDHFRAITFQQGVTVQVTPHSRFSEGLAVENSTNSGFEVYELRNGKGSYDLDWEVKAVRKGHEDYKPIVKWDEALPESKLSKNQLWSNRVASIQAAKSENVAP